MASLNTTRKGFLSLTGLLATTLVGCGTQQTNDSSNTTDTSSSSDTRETIVDGTNGGHAIEVSGEDASYTAVDVIKTGDDDGDEADFYGTNAAVYAEEGATLTLDDITVTTDGAHANAVFSYGEDTTITITESTIETSNNNSGGIMVTGGGTLEATDLTVHTQGNSSAAIRSDRGGGTQTVHGGTYTTEGTGSPVIYSTADVSVEDATLTSLASQGVVVEGKNSVALTNCSLAADNNTKNSDKSDWYQAVMIYQSMSGDAATGEAHFSVTGGSIDNANGDILFVNNTVATIELSDVAIDNTDTNGVFLRAAAAGWGSEGSNGGQVTLTASNQQISGDLLVDEVSTLNLYLNDSSVLVGAINPSGAEGEVYVELSEGSTWELSDDSYITSLTCASDAILTNGHTLSVGDTLYEEGSTSIGEAVEAKTVASSGGPGNGGGEPPEKPGNSSNNSGGPGSAGESSSGKPPAKPGEDNASTSD